MSCFFFCLQYNDCWFNIEQTVRVLSHEWAYSCEKAKRELGYKPRSLKEGLEEVLPWLKDLGDIKY